MANSDVCLRSRIRLARNIVDYPFPPVLDTTCRKEIIEKVAEALCKNGYTEDKELFAKTYSRALFEKNLVSNEFSLENELHGLFSNYEKDTHVMVCEEDHIRLQSFENGLALEGAYNKALECESLLGEKIKFAFNTELGYLTRCPTNLGTAMRASVMMFLPALTLSNRMAAIKSELEKIGMTIRGIYGEGSSADACIYQISNRLSLGISAEDIVRKTETIATRIENDEKEARASLLSQNTDHITDKIMRSLGILKFAHMISSKEFLDCFAFVRLGILLGVIKDVSVENLDKLLYEVMPAHLMLSSGDAAAGSQNRDILRAKKIKETI